VTDVLTRITALLAARPEGGELAGFLPPIARDDPNRAIRARTAVASTLLAGPELAREGVVTIEQDAPMSECWRRPAY
jgi:segregation and condensation protein A